jgi:hypothetical protein
MTDMVQQISDMIEPYVDRHLWELDDLSQRIVRLFETEIERLRTERTECEADLNAARASAEMAEARITAARAEMSEIIANHEPLWVSDEAKAAGKGPWVCQMCGTADGSWPCVTRMAADAALAALDIEGGAA